MGGLAEQEGEVARFVGIDMEHGNVCKVGNWAAAVGGVALDRPSS